MQQYWDMAVPAVLIGVIWRLLNMRLAKMETSIKGTTGRIHKRVDELEKENRDQERRLAGHDTELAVISERLKK